MEGKNGQDEKSRAEIGKEAKKAEQECIRLKEVEQESVVIKEANMALQANIESSMKDKEKMKKMIKKLEGRNEKNNIQRELESGKDEWTSQFFEMHEKDMDELRHLRQYVAALQKVLATAQKVKSKYMACEEPPL